MTIILLSFASLSSDLADEDAQIGCIGYRGFAPEV
jgi:hypothetical protein